MLRRAGALRSSRRPLWSRFWRDQRGVSAVELGLLLAGMTCVILAALGLLGTSLSDRFNSIATVLRNS